MSWTDPPLQCQLCGVTNHGVKPLLFKWALSEAHPRGMQYEHLDRCEKSEECRIRYEATGREWPEAQREEAR